MLNSSGRGRTRTINQLETMGYLVTLDRAGRAKEPTTKLTLRGQDGQVFLQGFGLVLSDQRTATTHGSGGRISVPWLEEVAPMLIEAAA